MPPGSVLRPLARDAGVVLLDQLADAVRHRAAGAVCRVLAVPGDALGLGRVLRHRMGPVPFGVGPAHGVRVPACADARQAGTVYRCRRRSRPIDQLQHQFAHRAVLAPFRLVEGAACGFVVGDRLDDIGLEPCAHGAAAGIGRRGKPDRKGLDPPHHGDDRVSVEALVLDDAGDEATPARRDGGRKPGRRLRQGGDDREMRDGDREDAGTVGPGPVAARPQELVMRMGDDPAARELRSAFADRPVERDAGRAVDRVGDRPLRRPPRIGARRSARETLQAQDEEEDGDAAHGARIGEERAAREGAAGAAFSPCGRRWPEGPDEG